MILANSAAQRLLAVLRTIDSNDKVTLPGQTRLDIARNINRLFADVQAFEKAINARRREIMPGEANIAANNAIVAELDQLGDSTIEVRLYKLRPTDLKLDDNPRITGEMVAALAPILKDFDSGEGGDD